MAVVDAKRYTDWAFKLGSINVPIEPGTMAIGNDADRENIKSGGELTADLIQILKKKPFIDVSILDPSIISDFTRIEAGETFTSVQAFWRSYEEKGGLGNTYYSAISSCAVFIPGSLSGSKDSKAILTGQVRALFVAGTAWTIGTTSNGIASVTRAYYPTSITLGSSGSPDGLRSVNVDWTFNIQDDGELEPEYVYFDEFTQIGTAEILDLAFITQAMIQDGIEETVTVLFTDANNPSNTVSIALGTCKIFGSISGKVATLNFEKLI